jgi:hypothetical protein
MWQFAAYMILYIGNPKISQKKTDRNDQFNEITGFFFQKKKSRELFHL